MTPEILARLCPKVATLDARGGGGIPELTPLDVAAALAGLAPGPYHLARLAWVDDHRAESDLVQALSLAVSPPRRPEDRPPWLGALALAIAEYCWPPRCGECEGHGVVWTPKPGACLGCHGTGRGRWTEEKMAEAVGVDREAWRRVWRGRYERAYRCVSGWGSEVMSHLTRRLGGESVAGDQ